MTTLFQPNYLARNKQNGLFFKKEYKNDKKKNYNLKWRL